MEEVSKTGSKTVNVFFSGTGSRALQDFKNMTVKEYNYLTFKTKYKSTI